MRPTLIRPSNCRTMSRLGKTYAQGLFTETADTAALVRIGVLSEALRQCTDCATRMFRRRIRTSLNVVDSGGVVGIIIRSIRDTRRCRPSHLFRPHSCSYDLQRPFRGIICQSYQRCELSNGSDALPRLRPFLLARYIFRRGH